MEDNNPNQKLFQERVDRVNKAIRLEKTDRVPIVPFFASWPQRAEGSNYRDLFYDHEKAGKAGLDFYAKNPLVDATYGFMIQSGLANELAEIQTIDWPGRPGSLVSHYSSAQVIEREYLSQEEYPEMLNDFTGYMIRKYIPRAFPALKGLAGISFAPTLVITTDLLAPLYSADAQQACQKLAKIAAAHAESAKINAYYSGKLAEAGMPSFATGYSIVPYDILANNFRSTMGIFEDLTDEDMQEYMEQACDMFADQQIASLQYFRYVDLPVRRVFFPMHKGMDGFMSEEQYERLYWKPLKKVINALIDMDVTPFLYTEGLYNSRLDILTDVPKGKVLYHFEKVDMKEAKRKLGGIACISGNLPVSDLEFGRKETIIEKTKQLLDIHMPDGGYIFDFDGSLENAKQENLDAMFEILDKYGRY